MGISMLKKSMLTRTGEKLRTAKITMSKRIKRTKILLGVKKLFTFSMYILPSKDYYTVILAYYSYTSQKFSLPNFHFKDFFNT